MEIPRTSPLDPETRGIAIAGAGPGSRRVARKMVKVPRSCRGEEMRRSALEVLACPHCLGPLDLATDEQDVEQGTLRCDRESRKFPVVDGVPHLVRLDRVEWARSFAEAYSRGWQRDGWGSADPEYLLNLPHRDLTGRQTGKWRFKARTMEALFAFLDELSPRRVVDLGCGVGWLSHHLARRGYQVYALDIVRDRVLGLGAAGVYVRVGPFFERVWGEL